MFPRLTDEYMPDVCLTNAVLNSKFTLVDAALGILAVWALVLVGLLARLALLAARLWRRRRG